MNHDLNNGADLFEHKLCFRSYGVPILLESNDGQLLRDAAARAEKALAGNYCPIAPVITPHRFGIFGDSSGNYSLRQNDTDSPPVEDKQLLLKYFDSLVRVAVAEYAKGWVFVHAGAVEWRGKAIVYPATSFGGKSTLTAEFVKQGATYYSDDFAVFGSDARVYPFARPLSMRKNRSRPDHRLEEFEISVENLGGTIGSVPVSVGHLLFTRYEEGGVWNPVRLTPGQAMMEMISHTIPIRYAPNFSLKVLKKIVSNAILLKSNRNDAKQFAKRILNFIDNKSL